MAMDHVDDNALPYITGWSVIGGTLVGVISGMYLLVILGLVFTLTLLDWEDISLSNMVAPSFIAGWVIIWGAPAGAIGGFVGSVVGFATRRRHYALRMGAVAGALGSLLHELEWDDFLFNLILALIGALAGWLGSRYATQAVAAKPKGYLVTFVIMGLAVGFTFLSMQVIRPKVCRNICLEEPCAPETCYSGEQRAGYPFAVLRDNNMGSSPISGWGILGPEDTPNYLAFTLDVLFYSALLWFIWKALLWIWLRNRSRRTNVPT